MSEKKTLLICVQAVDEQDPLMGFFVNWLREAAEYFSQITVLTLRVGEAKLPQNVRILPLRQRYSHSKIEVAWNVLKMSWRLRKDYECVFLRGDAQYAVLAGWLWFLLHKPVMLWYAHYTSRSAWLRPASWFTTYLVTSVREACELPRAILIGQGVDTKRFFTKRTVSAIHPRLCIFGRLSAVKRVPWMMQQARSVSLDAEVTIFGRANSAMEYDALHAEIGRAVWMNKDIPNQEAAQIFSENDILLNATPGSLDKVIVEAMLSGMVVIASTNAYRELLPVNLKWLAPSDDDFAKVIQRAYLLQAAERDQIGQQLQKIAQEMHSQTQQIKKIFALLSGEKH